MCGKLPGEQAEVIRRRYKLDQRNAEIAEKLNIEPTTSYDISAPKGDSNTLQANNAVQQAAEILLEYWQAKAYQGAGVGTFQRTWTSSNESCIETSYRLLKKARLTN